MKRAILKMCMVTVIGIGLSGSGYAQQLGGTAPDPKMLPDAAKTDGAMGNIYSPSLYDGTVNVTIPIYQYSNDAGNFGISFSYNTRGVKVDEMASAAGLHWNINAEGSIQRTVKGMPDEFNIRLQTGDSIWGDVNTRYYAFKGRLAASFETPTQAADPEVYRDGESDDFMVSAGGLSFTFNIGRDRQIYVNSKKDIKVELFSDGVPYVTAVGSNPVFYEPNKLEFRVTDVQGNQYYFKAGTWDANQMYAEPDVDALANYIANYNLVSHWVLTEVTLANGSKIKYNFKNGARDEYTYLSYSATDVGTTLATSSVVKKNNYYQQLKSIEYPNGVTAYFVYDMVRRRLDLSAGANSTSDTTGAASALREIRIQSGDNCLRYRMDQSYTVAEAYSNSGSGAITELPYSGTFVDITQTPYYPNEHIPGQRSHRLRLNGITLLSCDSSKEEPYYSFTYNSTKLPLRFNCGQDYFGYYNGYVNIDPYPGQNNGVDQNMTIPYHQTAVSGFTFSYGVNRSENATNMKAGILTEVKNAYGGKVAFDYEGHIGMEECLSSLPSNNYFFGKGASDGLRIHNITETDAYYPSNSRVTIFGYIGGQLFLNGGYFHAPHTMGNFSPSSSEFGTGNFTGNFTSPHQFVNGSNHGYSQVTVTTKDNSNNLLSKKEVLFSNFKDATSSNQPRYTLTAGSKNYYDFPFTDKQYLRDWEMGLPLEVTEYDANGKVTTKTFNAYAFSIDTVTSVARNADGLKATFVKDFSKTAFPVSDWRTPKTAVTDPYKPFFGTAQLSSTVIRKFISDANYIADTVLYAYDGHDNLGSISTYNSRGQVITTKHYYNYDMPVVSGSTILPGQERILSTQRWKKEPGGTDSVLLDAFFSSYTYQLDGTRPVKIWNKALYNLLSGTPLTTSQYASGTYNNTGLKGWAAYNGNAIADFRKTSEVQLFDTIGNPLETRMAEQNLYKAMIWDTKTGQKLAEAANCHYADIGFTSFETANKGNFVYDILGVQTLSPQVNGPVSGDRAFSMNSFRPTIGMSGLDPAKTYVISFWAKDGVPTLTGSGISSFTFNMQAERGSWKYYTGKFTPANSGTYNIQYNGTALLIDEIRLFPDGAAMQCMTYEPLFGIRTQTDATGRISYIEYDKLGRQNIVRDQQGNIISKTQFALHETQ